MSKAKLCILFGLTLLLFFSGLTLPAKCQEHPSILWIETFDGGSSDQAYDSTVDSLDNIIVTGLSAKGTNSYMTVKYDSNGNQLWNKTDGNGNKANSITIDSLDNIIVTGIRFNGYMDSFFTIKYDENGNILWSKNHGEEWRGEGVVTDSQNNVIIVGYYYIEDMMGQWDIIIVKCDARGNQLWSRIFDDLDGERAFDVAIDSDDNILVTGFSYTGFTRDLITIKYDDDGNLLWTRTYNGGYRDEGHGVVVDSMDNVIVTGFTSDTYYRYFLTIKYDKDGNRLWTRTNREENQDEASSLTVNSNDDILVTGWSFDGTYKDLIIIEYDKDGNQNWITSHEGSPTYGSLVDIRGYSIAVDSMDDIVVAGTIFYIIPQKISDFFTIKYKALSPTASPTPAPTPTASPTPAPTPTASPTPAPTPTASPTPTPTPTPENADVIIKNYDIITDDSVFQVITKSNSTISDFQYISEDLKLQFSVTGSAGTFGFCNITIPNLMLGGPFHILFDEQPLSDILSLDNGTHTWLYINYIQSTHKIEINTLAEIPDFSLVILIVITITFVAVLVFGVFKRKNIFEKLKKKKYRNP